VPVLVTTIDTRGSRRTASMRCRCAPAVSQKRPSLHRYDMMTPTGQPSRVTQLKVHSACSARSAARASSSSAYRDTRS
jgi:hypothetical protein